MAQDSKTVLVNHKGETNAHILSDSQDRSKLCKKIEEAIYPLSPETHPTNLIIQIVTRKIVSSANVDQALSIENQMMTAYKTLSQTNPTHI